MGETIQTIVNWMFTIIMFGVGLVTRNMWQSIKDLRDSDTEITRED